jgi:hypothetical protein
MLDGWERNRPECLLNPSQAGTCGRGVFEEGPPLRRASKSSKAGPPAASPRMSSMSTILAVASRDSYGKPRPYSSGKKYQMLDTLAGKR